MKLKENFSIENIRENQNIWIYDTVKYDVSGNIFEISY